MANKASKTLARTNTLTLTRTHITTVTLHILFILYRLLYRHGSIAKYLLLSAPALILEFYLERLGRPRYQSSTGELVSPGEDLAAAGVTEYCWDVIYVTWIVLGLVGVFGEWAWWVGLIVPAYGAFLAITTWKDMRDGIIPGMPRPVGGGEGDAAAGQSKRQKKLEKRGGQQVRYR